MSLSKRLGTITLSSAQSYEKLFISSLILSQYFCTFSNIVLKSLPLPYNNYPCDSARARNQIAI